MSDLYTPTFYDIIRPGVRSSAAVIVPLMYGWYMDNAAVPEGLPSIVDVGCGEGWWALEWVTTGRAFTADGIDGPWPGAGSVLVHRDDTGFRGMDLADPNLDNPRYSYDSYEYDIAMCLEVAEHISTPAPLLKWLRTLAPVVFFSGAVPGQPGAGHVSCRWQHEWAALFTTAGWHVADPIRPQVWRHPNVDWWYAQNLFVAWDPNGPVDADPGSVMSMIHPRFWEVR